MINKNIDDDNESFDDTTSSNNFLSEFEDTLSSSSSSELNLSIILETSSLSLTLLDNNQQEFITDNENMSLTSTQTISDNESVLYLRLSDELNIVEATLDSDLDRIER